MHISLKRFDQSQNQGYRWIDIEWGYKIGYLPWSSKGVTPYKIFVQSIKIYFDQWSYKFFLFFLCLNFSPSQAVSKKLSITRRTCGRKCSKINEYVKNSHFSAVFKPKSKAIDLQSTSIHFIQLVQVNTFTTVYNTCHFIPFLQ